MGRASWQGWVLWVIVAAIDSPCGSVPAPSSRGKRDASSNARRSASERQMVAERAAARAAARAAEAGVQAAPRTRKNAAECTSEVAELRARLAERDAEVVSLRRQLEVAPLGRMEPTNVAVQGRKVPLARQPSFQELHQALYGRPWDSKANLWTEFPNHYRKEPNFSYTHSPFWEEYKVEQFFNEISK